MEKAAVLMEKDATYRLREEVIVRNLHKGDHRLDAWIPLPQNDANQQILELTAESNAVLSLHFDREWGNALLFGRLPSATEFRAVLEYRVLRRAEPADFDPARARPLSGARGPFLRSLTPERYVRVDEETREQALRLLGAEKNPLIRAKILYDHVTGYMTYDVEKQSWKGSTDHALVCQVGNCNDIHALYLSLCRSAGIPGRLVMGFALEEPVEGQEPCDVCGYHCWAEIYVAGLGWLPVDASCACKYGHAGFGTLDLNHVAFSRGRDILLEPPQGGERLLFFPSAYVEVDGAPCPGVERRLRFEPVGVSD